MDALTITIYPASEGGFLYDIYQGELEEVADRIVEGHTDSLDGGLCTTSMLNALGMAVAQVGTLLKHKDTITD